MQAEQTIELGNQESRGPGNANQQQPSENNSRNSHGHGHQNHSHKGCQHGNCSHDKGEHKGGFFKFIQQYDSSTRAILYYHLISGNIFFRILMGLPFFPQFYQIYFMAKTMIIDQPLNLFLGFTIQLLSKTNINRNIKQLLGGFLIPLLILNFFIFNTVLNQVLPNLYSQHLMEPLILGSLFMNSIFFMMVYFSNPGYLNNPEDKKKFAYFKEIRPELSTPKFMCYECGEPRIVRSNHCFMCHSCVTKWETHSQLFNKCIGAGNQIFFLIFLGFYSFLLFLLFLTFMMKKSSNYHLNFSCALSFFLVSFLLYSYLKEFILQLIMVGNNLTSYEIMNFGRLPYLWRTKKREFFNPFDRGLIWNFREAFEPLMSFARHENKKPVATDIEESGSLREKPYSLDISFPVSFINWVEVKFFNILDIPISPFRDHVLDEMAKGKVPLPVGASFNPQTRTLHFSKEYAKACEEKRRAEFGNHEHGPGCSHGHGHENPEPRRDNTEAAKVYQDEIRKREELFNVQREQENIQAQFQKRMMNLQGGMMSDFPSNPIHQASNEKTKQAYVPKVDKEEEEEKINLIDSNKLNSSQNTAEEEKYPLSTKDGNTTGNEENQTNNSFSLDSSRREERPLLLQQESVGEDEKNPFH